MFASSAKKRSDDKTGLDKTSSIVKTELKGDKTEDNWDLDIENEIDFDEMEGDATTKKLVESKSDDGSIAENIADASAKESGSKSDSNKDIDRKQASKKKSFPEESNKNFIKLVCIHCDSKCVTFRVRD